MQACSGNVDQASSLLQQHMAVLSQPTPSAVLPASGPHVASLASLPLHSHQLTIDLERSGTADFLHQGSAPTLCTVQPRGSKQVLLPSGVTAYSLAPPVLVALQPCQGASASNGTTARSGNSTPTVQHHRSKGQSGHTYSMGSSEGESDLYNASHIGHQVSASRPGFTQMMEVGILTAEDPVAAAIDEAGKVVQEKSRMNSVANQERQAMGLHAQARDTYFAAAQVAYEKGTVYCWPQ